MFFFFWGGSKEHICKKTILVFLISFFGCFVRTSGMFHSFGHAKGPSNIGELLLFALWLR